MTLNHFQIIEVHVHGLKMTLPRIRTGVSRSAALRWILSLFTVWRLFRGGGSNRSVEEHYLARSKETHFCRRRSRSVSTRLRPPFFQLRKWLTALRLVTSSSMKRKVRDSQDESPSFAGWSRSRSPR